jgi:hypothetical protein
MRSLVRLADELVEHLLGHVQTVVGAKVGGLHRRGQVEGDHDVDAFDRQVSQPRIALLRPRQRDDREHEGQGAQRWEQPQEIRAKATALSHEQRRCRKAQHRSLAPFDHRPADDQRHQRKQPQRARALKVVEVHAQGPPVGAARVALARALVATVVS